ncbi:M4 family metallopeptidase [Methanobacterium formicicum]|uniref:M4 family metallopeptidase n=1 Tax=Methanobacterium formicicum TaxID=2162 RepID=UPI002491F52A|nr:M4 family metallopeptidase [Methanobacterium formicicum]
MIFNNTFNPAIQAFEFIPPHIMGGLARQGIDEARLTIQQSRFSRRKRSEKMVNLKTFSGKASGGKSNRAVYDSQNTYENRVKLVREEGGSPSPDETVNNAYDYVGQVFDYFQEVMGRDSIDNRGMELVINVHFGEKYQNAFWDGDEIVLGDGDGKLFTNFSKSLDVIAHELGHGITQFSANFNYRGQSGALHEHFSDVFGSAITQRMANQDARDADWLIGNEIMGPELYGESIRSMSEPGTAYDNSLLGKDQQPSHMDNYYQGSADNFGVHINSGIPNKAFYLASIGIGTDKSVLIWYKSLQKLWPNANFNDAVKVIVETTRDLVKEGLVPQGATQKVRTAFREVGLPK